MQVTRGEGLSAGINLRISGGGAIGRVDINTLSKGLASGSAMVRLTQERSAGSSIKDRFAQAEAARKRCPLSDWIKLC
jgi:hypothetical protein